MLRLLHMRQELLQSDYALPERMPHRVFAQFVHTEHYASPFWYKIGHEDVEELKKMMDHTAKGLGWTAETEWFPSTTAGDRKYYGADHEFDGNSGAAHLFLSLMSCLLLP